MDGLGSGQRELARLRALVAESRTHLKRAATALEQLERRVALLEAEQPGPGEAERNGHSPNPTAAAAAGQPDRQSGKTLYDLAVAAMVRGDDDKAEDSFKQALAIFTEPPADRTREADILHKMGGLAIRKGEYLARARLREALP
jgi:TolA-binding protein